MSPGLLGDAPGSRAAGSKAKLAWSFSMRGELFTLTLGPWFPLDEDFSSPFWPSSSLGGNRGREQGGFLLVGLLAGLWREDDRQTRRKRAHQARARQRGFGKGRGMWERSCGMDEGGAGYVVMRKAGP